MMRPVRTAIMISSPALLIALGATTFAPGALAHEGLHVNESNETCDFEFSADLTQSAFARFTREVGDIVVFKNGGAAVLPAGRAELGIGYSSSPIDQHSAAWNDTFTHPDAGHELGDAISLPMLYGRIGLGRGMDLGAYFTGNPDASYRLAGLGLKRSVHRDAAGLSSLAVSLDYGLLFGPDDTTVHALGTDLHAGRTWEAFTAHASAGLTWAHAVERSPVVALESEDTVGPHGSVGVSPRLWRQLNMDITARFASANTFEVRFGHIF